MISEELVVQNNGIDKLWEFLFPYRAHLEREIAYLKAQLAQERRRVDVLQEGILESKRPIPNSPRGALTNKRPVPIGWDATRAEERHAASKDEPSILPARPDAGSEGADADKRLEA